MKVPDYKASHKDFRIKVPNEGFGSRFHIKVKRFHIKIPDTGRT